MSHVYRAAPTTHPTTKEEEFISSLHQRALQYTMPQYNALSPPARATTYGPSYVHMQTRIPPSTLTYESDERDDKQEAQISKW